MKIRVLMLVTAAIVLLSGAWVTASASDWSTSDWDEMSWDDADWDWSGEPSTAAPMMLLTQQSQTTIPEYPRSYSSTYPETEEPIKGTLRSYHVTGDSAIRVAGYYQWQLGLAAVEIRPYQYVIQTHDQDTGLYTIIVIKPESGVSGGWASVDASGATIAVIDADTPHESLAAGVASLGAMDAPDSGGMDFASAFGDGEMDPSMLFALMMMMGMMMGGEEGMEWSTEGYSEDMTYEWDWGTDSWGDDGDYDYTWSWDSDSSDSSGSDWDSWDDSSWDSWDDSSWDSWDNSSSWDAEW
jgi:hypothetical protein